MGEYWGYLYATVDGAPANALPVLTGNRNSLGQPAGYKTLYAPEQQTTAGPGAVWVRIARGLAAAQPHVVRLEIWRSWGQHPLRGVALAPPPSPFSKRWPGILLLVLAGWGIIWGFGVLIQRWRHKASHMAAQWLPGLTQRLQAPWLTPWAMIAASSALVLIAGGVMSQQWLFVLAGLALLGVAALIRPVLWLAALLMGLPFYYGFPLPILPGRALSLIDIAIFGGLVITLIQPSFVPSNVQGDTTPGRSAFHVLRFLLWIMVSWALVASFAADHLTIALREWRLVFLAAGILAWLLWQNPLSNQDQWLLVGAWLVGGSLVALAALWQYWADSNLITAEGVWRVRAFYGSPNNLALYLDRTLAVALALALFARQQRNRWLSGGLALLQLAALLLTFSKGALLLGIPAMLATLWLGGVWLLPRQGRTRQPLWWIAAAGLLIALSLLPFLGTERFQRLLDFQQGTGFVRLNLWRSAWHMAVDHLWLGVGPDNFLYQYRSYYLLPAAWQEPNLNHPHNWLLDWWTRLGLPGLILALLFFGRLLQQLGQAIQQTDQPVLALGLLAATVAALAHGLIDASYALPDLMLIWVLIAYLAGAMSAEQTTSAA
jgi:O-antigen ligase